MNQFRVTAHARVNSHRFGRYAEMCAVFFALSCLGVHTILILCKLKRYLTDAFHSNIDKNKIPVLRYRKLKTV